MQSSFTKSPCYRMLCGCELVMTVVILRAWSESQWTVLLGCFAMVASQVAVICPCPSPNGQIVNSPKVKSSRRQVVTHLLSDDRLRPLSMQTIRQQHMSIIHNVTWKPRKVCGYCWFEPMELEPIVGVCEFSRRRVDQLLLSQHTLA